MGKVLCFIMQSPIASLPLSMTVSTFAGRDTSDAAESTGSMISKLLCESPINICDLLIEPICADLETKAADQE